MFGAFVTHRRSGNSSMAVGGREKARGREGNLGEGKELVGGGGVSCSYCVSV